MTQEGERYQEFTPPPVLPEGVVRRERKPRYRQADRDWRTRNLKVLFLKAFAASGHTKETCDLVRIPKPTVESWLVVDKEFKDAYQAVKRTREDVIRESLLALDEPAVRAVKEAIEQTEDWRLRASTAMRLLKSHGHLPDAPSEGEQRAIQTSGIGGKLIHKIEIVAPSEGGVAVRVTTEEKEG